MTEKNSKSFADESMLELFRMEVEQQASVLPEGLLTLEQDPAALPNIEPLMRAEDMNLSTAQKAECAGLEASLSLVVNGETKSKPRAKKKALPPAANSKEAPAGAAVDQPRPASAPAPSHAEPVVRKSPPRAAATPMKIGSGFSDPTMLELFRLEVEQHGQVLTDGLLRLEENPEAPERIEPLMRAAHSIKGEARLVGIHIAVDIAHRMEDCLVAAQHGKLSLSPDDIDVLLKGNDLLSTIAQLTENVDAVFSIEQQVAYDHLLDALADVLAGRKPAKMSVIAAAPATAPHNDVGEEAEPAAAMETKPSEGVPQPRIVGPKPK